MMEDITPSLRQRKASTPKVEERTSSISFKRLDVYPKLQEDFKVQTSSGATLSIISAVIMFILFVSEFSAYLKPIVTDRLVVDTTLGEKLQINFNMTFHGLTCAEVNMDAMDVSGEQQNGVDHTLLKVRLSKHGVPIGDAYAEHMDVDITEGVEEDYCGDCYGAKAVGECCNSCDVLREAYRSRGWSFASLANSAEQCLRDMKNPSAKSVKGEGCNISGYMKVNKVAGNFHVALGSSHSRDGRHIHSFSYGETMNFNVSHTIHRLSFGDPALVAALHEEDHSHPLDGMERIVHKGTGVAQYFIKIVPTVHKGVVKVRSAAIKDHATADAHSTAKKVAAGLASEAELAAHKERSSGGGGGGGKERGALGVMTDVIQRQQQQGMRSNRYSVTSQFKPVLSEGMYGEQVLPGVFFVYELSPFMVEAEVSRVPFTHFLTQLCAIVGGVFTVTGFVDSLIYHVSKSGKKLVQAKI